MAVKESDEKISGASFPELAMEDACAAMTRVKESDEENRSLQLLDKAVKYYTEMKDRSFSAFSRQGQFIDGDLYVFVLNSEGRMLASGGPSCVFINQDVSAIRDVTGKQFIKELIDDVKTKSSGKIEYRWKNWSNGKIEKKVTYCQKVDDRIICVGYYIPHATKEQAVLLLEEAVNAFKKDQKSAVSEFNDMSGKFIKDDLYVFVVDMEKAIIRAHGVNPRLIGSSMLELKDIQDKSSIRRAIKLVKKNGQGTLDYKWKNPVTGKYENKHDLLRRADNYIIGVGYFTR